MINFIHIHIPAIASCIALKDKVLLETISARQWKELLLRQKSFTNWFSTSTKCEIILFFSLKILDSPSATWCENNWQGAQKGPRQFPLISCHADDMLDFSTLANFRHQEIFCASARLIVSMKHTIYMYAVQFSSGKVPAIFAAYSTPLWGNLNLAQFWTLYLF